MMKVLKTILPWILGCALMLMGCSGGSAPETTVPADPTAATAVGTGPVMATADQVLAAAGLTADDLPGVDIDVFIAEENLTPDLLNQLSADVLKEALLAQTVPVTDSCAYLIFDDSNLLPEGEVIDMAQVKRIAVVAADDGGNPSLMVDLEVGKAYLDNVFFFDDLASAIIVTDLTDELRAEVSAAVEAANVNSWDRSYIDSTSDPDSDLPVVNWIIVFETTDGIARYVAQGINPNAPQEYFDLGVALFSLFW